MRKTFFSIFMMRRSLLLRHFWKAKPFFFFTPFWNDCEMFIVTRSTYTTRQTRSITEKQCDHLLIFLVTLEAIRIKSSLIKSGTTEDIPKQTKAKSEEYRVKLSRLRFGRRGRSHSRVGFASIGSISKKYQVKWFAFFKLRVHPAMSQLNKGLSIRSTFMYMYSHLTFPRAWITSVDIYTDNQ